MEPAYPTPFVSHIVSFQANAQSILALLASVVAVCARSV